MENAAVSAAKHLTLNCNLLLLNHFSFILELRDVSQKLPDFGGKYNELQLLYTNLSSSYLFSTFW